MIRGWCGQPGGNSKSTAVCEKHDALTPDLWNLCNLIFSIQAECCPVSMISFVYPKVVLGLFSSASQQLFQLLVLLHQLVNPHVCRDEDASLAKILVDDCRHDLVELCKAILDNVAALLFALDVILPLLCL